MTQWTAKAMAEHRILEPRFVFTSLALVFGLVLVLLVPPLSAQDEPAHFLRAYQISEGRFLAERRAEGAGGMLPASLETLIERSSAWREATSATPVRLRDVLESRAITLRPHERTFQSFSNTALYAPTLYVPQALAILLGRSLGLPPLYLTYLARLAVLVTWLALGRWAVRTMPTGRWSLVALLMLPMSVYLSASAAPDAVMIALAAITVALTMRLTTSEMPPTREQWSQVLLVSIAVALSKPPYCLAFLLFLLVPWSHGRRRSFVLAWAIAMIAALAIVGGWQLAASRIWVPARVDIAVSPAEQLSYLAQHPLAFPAALVRTYATAEGRNVVWGFIGSVGDAKTFLPTWLRLVGLVQVAVGLLALQPLSRRLSRARTWIALLVPSLIFVAVNVLVYLTFSPIGGPVIEVVFGRYLLPVAILALPWLSAVRPRNLPDFRWASVATASLAAFMSIAGVAVVAEHFY